MFGWMCYFSGVRDCSRRPCWGYLLAAVCSRIAHKCQLCKFQRMIALLFFIFGAQMGSAEAAERDHIGKGGCAEAAPDMMSSILAKLRAQRQGIIARCTPPLPFAKRRGDLPERRIPTSILASTWRTCDVSGPPSKLR